MIPFVPSAEFQRFFDAVIAAAEAPVVAGTFTMPVPTFSDPREQAFAQVKLVPLIGQIDAMRRSITAVSTPAAPAPSPADYWPTSTP